MRLAHQFTRFGTVFMASIALTLVFSTSASAQSFGIRAGVSADPDQFYFGGHMETKPVVDRLHFRPNVEVGVGDGLTLVGLNFEFAYKFRTRKDWGVYAGGGPALNLIYSDPRDHAEGGFNILLGLEHRNGFFGEIKVGAIDSPDFKLGVGYRLH